MFNNFYSILTGYEHISDECQRIKYDYFTIDDPEASITYDTRIL